MASRRRAGAHGRSYGSKRLTNWNAPFVQTATSNVATGVTSLGTLVIAPDDGVTIIRIIGNLGLAPQADTRMIAHYGIIMTPEGQTAPEPDVATGVEQSLWLWWGSRTYQPAAINTQESANIPFDVRVKRKMREDDTLSIIVVCNQAYNFNFQVRLLEMAT